MEEGLRGRGGKDLLLNDFVYIYHFCLCYYLWKASEVGYFFLIIHISSIGASEVKRVFLLL